MSAYEVRVKERVRMTLTRNELCLLSDLLKESIDANGTDWTEDEQKLALRLDRHINPWYYRTASAGSTERKA